MAEAEASDSVSALRKVWRRRSGDERERGGNERASAATAMVSSPDGRGMTMVTAASAIVRARAATATAKVRARAEIAMASAAEGSRTAAATAASAMLSAATAMASARLMATATLQLGMGEEATATSGMGAEEIAKVIVETKQRGLWSQLRPQRRLGAAPRRGYDPVGDDAVVWEQLKHSYPTIFVDSSEGEVRLGKLIAEGGQAQIYLASVRGYTNVVAKVFKMQGFSLADVERQWPRATFSRLDPGHCDNSADPAGRVVFDEFKNFCSLIWVATFLKDGRFAFVMDRYWGDLRTLIDFRLKGKKSQRPPFSPRTTVKIMWCIAMGIKELHDVGVLHRDLKAANVLVKVQMRSDPRHDNKFFGHVADYESGMLVVGTGFWRAPEVLKELMENPCDIKDGIWTEKVDAYSYAMTYYEVLTGQIPFSEYSKKDWQKVIDGERPCLSDYIDPKTRDLVERCWHHDPSKRPCFEAILSELRERLCQVG